MAANPLAGIPLRIARWSARHSWTAIGGWLVFVVVAVGLASVISTKNTTDADYRVGDSGRADALIVDAGLDRPPTENVLITGHGGADPDRAEADATAAAISASVEKLPRVTGVSPPQWSRDHHALLVGIDLRKGTDDVTDLQAVTAAAQKAHTDLVVRQAGDASIDDAVNTRVGEDLGSAEGISLPITLILMLLAFGAVIAAGVPVLVGATSVAATVGLTAPLSHLIHAEDSVTSMIVLIGMAVGVDYSLFYLKREREERAKGHSTVDAVEIAARTSGHSILVSGLAVIASLAGLFIVGGVTFDSLATGSIVVVAVAVVGSLTVLPALLSKLGRWVDRPRIPLLWRLTNRVGRGAISRRILGPVMRHPVAAIVLGVVITGALAGPALGMKVHQSNLDSLPQTIPEVRTMEAIESAFPSEAGTAVVVVKAAASQRDAVDGALGSLHDAAVRTPDFAPGKAELTASRDGTVTVLRLPMRYLESDGRADDAVQHLRTRLMPTLERELPRAEVHVGGGVAESYDTTHLLRERLPIVVGVVLLLTFLTMAVAFRSVPIAILSTVLNLASVGAAFGLLTLVFQHGWFQGTLDFTSPGFVVDWIPLFVLVVLVGLSMDYHVFVVSRIREHVRSGLPTTVATARGVAETSGVVTSAAAVMVSVFAIFATLSMLEMKMIGVGLAVAVLLDATLIRQVVLPAALTLMGDRAWWPVRARAPRAARVVEPEPAYADIG